MPTPPREGARWYSIRSSVTRASGVRPSKVAALITLLRRVIGPSWAGVNTLCTVSPMGCAPGRAVPGAGLLLEVSTVRGPVPSAGRRRAGRRVSAGVRGGGTQAGGDERAQGGDLVRRQDAVGGQRRAEATEDQVEGKQPA